MTEKIPVETNAKERILYIDDNYTNLALFKEVLGKLYDVYITSSPSDALQKLGSGIFKVVFVDYLMPEISGLEFITKAKKTSPESLYIIITAHADLQVVISAINQGDIFRFIEKPWDVHELISSIISAVELYDLRFRNRNLMEHIRKKNDELTRLKEQLEDENQYLQEEIERHSGFEEIITRDPHVHKVLKKVKQVSVTGAAVLILGETGTGKELIAQAIHNHSERKNKPFIKLNCAAIPESLIESELFGHHKGAFTGATENRKGKFELAHQGTIFLDEIGELPIHLQPKLLRVLQDGYIEKLGGKEPIQVDVRIISATNRNLVSEMGKGNFRHDLYYRLNVFPVSLPPLRDRPDDILLLADYFIKKHNLAYNKHAVRVSAQARKILYNYSWPGNIRELENVIERAVIISEGNQLRLPEDLAQDLHEDPVAKAFQTLHEVEKAYIVKVLQSTDYRVSGEKGAARVLGMNPTTLESRMKKLGIAKP